jgi:hypothetical protein
MAIDLENGGIQTGSVSPPGRSGARAKQKPGRLRSETAARDRYAIRGYASTAVKHGTDTLTAIRDALAGKLLDASRPRNRLTAPNSNHAAQSSHNTVRMG